MSRSILRKRSTRSRVRSAAAMMRPPKFLRVEPCVATCRTVTRPYVRGGHTMTTAGLQMTHHADHRCAQHTAPDCVLELLRTGGGADFLGRHPNHPRVQLRIVRTADSYWIAPHANGTMVTIYEKDARDIDAWASKHLHPPEQTRIGCV